MVYYEEKVEGKRGGGRGGVAHKHTPRSRLVATRTRATELAPLWRGGEGFGAAAF